ncbi:MAG TPA: hypothetical protein DHW02_13680 [Ktedonobacter sp.]|nr:hypothetical protein [Ktedonobacter sp.]
MNIWDSVHRGLEKASQEAARIAKIQRLRSTMDTLVQQLNTQQGLVITKAMDLYLSGQLPPGGLLTACQQLESTHQRVNQLQNELNQLQSQQNMSTGNQGNQGTQRGQGTPSGTQDAQATQLINPDAPSSYAPPPPGYQPYDSAVPPLVPPPPPRIDVQSGQSGQSTDTAGMISPPPLVERNHCPVCHIALIPGNAFCHNCGTPVAFAADAQQLTVRSGTDTQPGAGMVGNASLPVGENEPPEVIDEY